MARTFRMQGRLFAAGDPSRARDFPLPLYNLGPLRVRRKGGDDECFPGSVTGAKCSPNRGGERVKITPATQRPAATACKRSTPVDWNSC